MCVREREPGKEREKESKRERVVYPMSVGVGYCSPSRPARTSVAIMLK